MQIELIYTEQHAGNNPSPQPWAHTHMRMGTHLKAGTEPNLARNVLEPVVVAC